MDRVSRQSATVFPAQAAQGLGYKPYEPVEANNSVPYRANSGKGHNILVDGQMHDHMGTHKGHDPAASAACLHDICNKITRNADRISNYETYEVDDAYVIPAAYGSVARTALRAARDSRAAGRKVGMIKLKTLFPFPEALFTGLARAGVPLRSAGNEPGTPVARRTVGQRIPTLSLPKVDGDMHTPEEIVTAIMRSE